jgi:hypothetical protein
VPDRFERLGLLHAMVALGGGAQPIDGHGGQVRNTATQRGLGRAERWSVAAPDQQRADRLARVDDGDCDPGGEGLQKRIRRPGVVRFNLGGEHRRPSLEGQRGRAAVAQRAHQSRGTAVAPDQPQARLAVDPQEDRGQIGAGRGAGNGSDVRHRLLDRGPLQQTAKGRKGPPLARAHVVPRMKSAHRRIGRSAPGRSRPRVQITQALCPSSLRVHHANSFKHIAVATCVMPPGRHATSARI